ncbi:MAG: hypothetical protein RML99_13090 [Anaerolineae bacterium]|nr:hypothetical protein [Anaerolineae bacterium]
MLSMHQQGHLPLIQRASALPTSRAQITPCLAQCWQDWLQDDRPIFRQHRSFLRFVWLALGLVLALARRTLTQSITALGQDTRDWSGWYRLLRGRAFSAAHLWQVLLQQTWAAVPVEQPDLTAIDTTPIWRSSHTLPGSR